MLWGEARPKTAPAPQRKLLLLGIRSHELSSGVSHLSHVSPFSHTQKEEEAAVVLPLPPYLQSTHPACRKPEFKASIPPDTEQGLELRFLILQVSALTMGQLAQPTSTPFPLSFVWFRCALKTATG